MSIALLISLVIAAEPSPEQLALLKTFRSEFVAVTPGETVFPKSFLLDGKNAASSGSIRISIQHSFAIAKYEVPQNLWEAVMGENPSKWKGKRNSVELLSFDEAQAFCRRATDLMRTAGLIEADEVIRLPSESEWEYVARAGTDTLYSFGDDPKLLGDFAWFTGNAAGNDPPVGAKNPNPAGLYDIHGYLWEWCEDVWHPDYQGIPTDGSAWLTGGDATQRVLRGGSWKDTAEKLTSSHRRAAAKELRDDAVGLRCVLSKAK